MEDLGDLAWRDPQVEPGVAVAVREGSLDALCKLLIHQLTKYPVPELRDTQHRSWLVGRGCARVWRIKGVERHPRRVRL